MAKANRERELAPASVNSPIVKSKLIVEPCGPLMAWIRSEFPVKRECVACLRGEASQPALAFVVTSRDRDPRSSERSGRTLSCRSVWSSGYEGSVD